jgi:hypothetical protein
VLVPTSSSTQPTSRSPARPAYHLGHPHPEVDPVPDFDFDAPARRSRPSALPAILAGIGVVPWAVLAVAVLAVGSLFFAAMGKATSAVQEASIAASTAAVLVGCYALARAAEKVLAAVGRLAERKG